MTTMRPPRTVNQSPIESAGLPDSNKSPKIVDPLAYQEFRDIAIEIGVDPDDPWVGRYVEYEWNHVRHVLQTYPFALAGSEALEFGCNFGASSIVMALLGVQVTAIDVNSNYLRLAQMNARAHGVDDRIKFVHIDDACSLPIETNRFALVNCNSVIEYVNPSDRIDVLREIQRVALPGGHISISGTSNRLAPVEVHCGLWFVNYFPSILDKLVFGRRRTERGVSPWTIRQGLRGCCNVDWETSGQFYSEVRRRVGASPSKLAIIRLLNVVCRLFGVWLGYLTPSISVVMRKM